MIGIIIQQQEMVKKQESKPNDKSSNKEQPTDESLNEQESAQKLYVLLAEDENGNIQDDKSDMEICLSRQKPMDTYFEETLSCMGKPVHSLESVETQVICFFVNCK